MNPYRSIIQIHINQYQLIWLLTVRSPDTQSFHAADDGASASLLAHLRSAASRRPISPEFEQRTLQEPMGCRAPIGDGLLAHSVRFRSWAQEPSPTSQDCHNPLSWLPCSPPFWAQDCSNQPPHGLGSCRRRYCSIKK